MCCVRVILLFSIFITSISSNKINITDTFNYIHENVNSSQEYFFIKKLIMVMKENWSVRHRRESYGWDSDFSQISGVQFHTNVDSLTNLQFLAKTEEWKIAFLKVPSNKQITSSQLQWGIRKVDLFFKCAQANLYAFKKALMF